MSARPRQIGLLLGAAIAIVAAYVAGTHSRSRDARETPATEAAPAPPTPPADEATRIARARTPAPPPSRPEPAPAPFSDDDDAMATALARDRLRADPEGALTLLDAADRAQPDGGLAEERAAMRVDALVFAQRIGPARDAAEVYLARYPHGPQAQRIQMLTGVHPRPAE